MFQDSVTSVLFSKMGSRVSGADVFVGDSWVCEKDKTLQRVGWVCGGDMGQHVEG